MPDNDNRSYYAARASKERALANDAINAAVRGIHTELAERYELLAIGELLPMPSHG